MEQLIKKCPCCANDTFRQEIILWPELVAAWKLSKEERDYINRQQGYICTNCGSNLRSMMLAAAIMRCYDFGGTLPEFVKKYKRKLDVLEVNEAGTLTSYMEKFQRHKLVSYPEVKMERLPIADNSYDLLIHSDTLEHVKDPIIALRESLRVLRPGGFTCFTIPIVIGRLTKSRKGMLPSYHGSPGNDEYLVVNEYGADMWTMLMKAGFSECRLISIDYPASVAVIGRKSII